MAKITFKFWAVPQSALADDRLETGEAILLGILYTRSNADLIIWPSKSFLARAMRVSEKSIQRYLSHLEELGFLLLQRNEQDHIIGFELYDVDNLSTSKAPRWTPVSTSVSTSSIYKDKENNNIYTKRKSTR